MCGQSMKRTKRPVAAHTFCLISVFKHVSMTTERQTHTCRKKFLVDLNLKKKLSIFIAC